MAPDHYLRDLRADPRVPGELAGRATRPLDHTLPQISSYFARPPGDAQHISPFLFTHNLWSGTGQSRLTERRDLTATALPSLPNQVLFDTELDSTTGSSHQLLDLHSRGSDQALPHLFSFLPNTATPQFNDISDPIEVPHHSRSLALEDPLRRQDQLFQPIMSRRGSSEASNGRLQGRRQVQDLDHVGNRRPESQRPDTQDSSPEPQPQDLLPQPSAQANAFDAPGFIHHESEHSQRNHTCFTAINSKFLDSHSSSSLTFVNSSPAAQASNRRQYSQQRSPSRADQSTRPSSSTVSKVAAASSPPVVNGIRLVTPTEVFPPKFHSAFPYEFLNAVQSRCFEAVYRSDDNVVVSAPTGCGKTAILDIAITKLASDLRQENAKVVYLAPTKALCKEKACHWASSFGPIGLQVSEFTGDTAKADMAQVRSARIIVTTFEKWDSITRSVVDHQRILSMVKLVLIDEVHFVKDPRGATLEVIVSRMKKRESKVRLIALSATIPNCEDVADWIGKSSANPSLPAHLEYFGPEFRPVPLEKKVIAFKKTLGDHAFDNFLNGELWKCLKNYTPGKSTLVFCMSKKGCQTAAMTLADEWEKARPEERMWHAPKRRIPVIDQELQIMVRCGVAFHHAGLTTDDKQAVEDAFRKGHLNVICCTSTLAVGVNTPCHTVVLKGTVGYQDSQLVEYSDMEIAQMLGRAGRPQFEKSALALILTKAQNKERYERLGSGDEVLESTLHRNLVEHLNSEIGRETVRDMDEAKKWMKGTFFYRRILKNPAKYDVSSASADATQALDRKTLDRKIEKICDTNMGNLEEAGMVISSIANDGRYIYRATDIGQAMSKYMIRFTTMKKLLQIPQAADAKEILHQLCEAAAADELKDTRWQASDKDCARECSKSSRFLYSIDPMGGIAHKLSLLIQMELAQIEAPAGNPTNIQRMRGETIRVFEVMNRLIRAVVECKVSHQDGDSCSAALSLARSLSTKAWEHSPVHLIQVPQIGKVMMRKLVGGNIRTVIDLAETPASTIERVTSRNPPFGKKMTDALAWFPRLTLCIQAKATRRPIKGAKSLDVDATLGFSNTVGTPRWRNKIPIVTFLAYTSKGVCNFFWRNSLSAFKRGRNTYTLSFSWTPTSLGEDIICEFACEEIAGTLVTHRLAHGQEIGNALSFSKPAERPFRPSKIPRISPSLALDEDISDTELLVAFQEAPKEKPHEPRLVTAHGEDHAISIADFPQVEWEGNTKVATTASSTSSEHRDLGLTKKMDSKQQPVRLENGNFKCGHSCSWSDGGRTARGVQCGHQCCREGSKHPPKPNKRGEKRKSEHDGILVSKPNGSSDSAKRARTTALAPHPKPHSIKDEYIVDEDGFLDLTREEGKLSPPATTQKRAPDFLDSELDMDLNRNEMRTFEWPSEIQDECSGETLSDETLILEADSCWTEFFAPNPPQKSPDDSVNSTSDRLTTRIESFTQGVPPEHMPPTEDEEIQKSHQFSHSYQSQRQMSSFQGAAATFAAHLDEMCMNEGLHRDDEMFGEPEWINEFDPDLIDEFRGLVDFV